MAYKQKHVDPVKELILLRVEMRIKDPKKVERLMQKIDSWCDTFETNDTNKDGLYPLKYDDTGNIKKELTKALNRVGIVISNRDWKVFVHRFAFKANNCFSLIQFVLIAMELSDRDPEIVLLSREIQNNYRMVQGVPPTSVFNRVQPILSSPVSPKKAALIIGVCYAGTCDELKSTVADAAAVAKFLTLKCGFSPNSVVLLTDGVSKYGRGVGWKGLPNKKNILMWLRRITNRAKAGGIEELWISYSGHGIYRADPSGDEQVGRYFGRGYDEVLCPLDFRHAGYVTDDQLAERISFLPDTCNAMVLMDCCNSESNCDLQFGYNHFSDTFIQRGGHFQTQANVVKIAAATDDQAGMESTLFGGSGWLTSRILCTLSHPSNKGLTYRQLIHVLEERRQIDVKHGILESNLGGLQGKAAQICNLAMSKMELLDAPCMGSPTCADVVVGFWQEPHDVFHRLWEKIKIELSMEPHFNDEIALWYDRPTACCTLM
eukprot:m.137802 g.137802  ORF g.137802 m.137802 type:complete len:489 (-) comp29949_c0_seq1:38-1504(-)